MADKTYKFDDTVVSTIAKTLQLALLTGTDVVDNLRQIEVTENTEGTLSVTDNYLSQFEHWIAKMLDELEQHNQQNTEEQTNQQPEQLSLFE